MVLDPGVAFIERSLTAERASRGTVRQIAGVFPDAPSAIKRPTALATRTLRAAARAVAYETKLLRAAEARRAAAVKAAKKAKVRQVARARQMAHRVAKAYKRTVTTKHVQGRRAEKVVPLGNGMNAVIAYARSQVGKNYVSGGEGPGGFDCSGFTKRAYAQAGIRLPHSSGAQASRARTVSRSQARPGDLVVGPGHVGIYMGRGMMIDAGNSRTGVVYRKLYSGLRVARL